MALDLYAFEKMFDSGIVNAIMTAHIWMPAFDDIKRPATLSPSVVTDYIKKRFDGMVITDAMDMGGITSEVEPEEAVVAALNAGCDMILMPPEPEKAVHAIIKSVQDENLTVDRLDDAVMNVLRIKSILGLDLNRLVEPSDKSLHVKPPQREEETLNIARKSITLVRNRGGLLPLSKDSNPAIISLVNKRGQTTIWREDYSFGRRVKAVCPDSRSVMLGDQIKKKQLDKAQKLASSADVIILALYPRVIIGAGEIKFSDEQLEMVQHLCGIGKPVVTLSFGSPYVFNDLPPCDAFLCCYGNADAVQQAAVDVIFGDVAPSGRLPITLNDTFMCNYGMTYHNSAGK
jgi:beta-N-acetylhexosaminidase